MKKKEPFATNAQTYFIAIGACFVSCFSNNSTITATVPFFEERLRIIIFFVVAGWVRGWEINYSCVIVIEFGYSLDTQYYAWV